MATTCELCDERTDLDQEWHDRLAMAREEGQADTYRYHDRFSRFRIGTKTFQVSLGMKRKNWHLCRRCWVTVLRVAAYHAARVLLGDLANAPGFRWAREHWRVVKKAAKLAARRKRFRLVQGAHGWVEVPVNPEQERRELVRVLRKIADGSEEESKTPYPNRLLLARRVARGALRRAGEAS